MEIWTHYKVPLRCKNPYCVKSVHIRSFFGSVFSHIRAEYGYLRGKSPYSVRMRETTDQKKLRIWTLFTSVSMEEDESFNVWDRSWINCCDSNWDIIPSDFVPSYFSYLFVFQWLHQIFVWKLKSQKGQLDVDY